MVDGRMISVVAQSVAVSIARGTQTVKLVKNIGPDYFEMLRTKLSWAMDVRFPNGAAQQ
jgi:hypothetical protein